MSKQTQFVSVIKAKIEKYTNYSEVIEDGNVISISDGVAIVSGLDNIMYNELVKFENGTLGIALNLNTDYVGVILLGKHEDIQENSKVVRTKKVVSVPVGDELIGRVINPLGVGIDGKKKIVTKKTMPIEKTAPGVMTRESVNEPLQTGILAIDAMFPIGKGQRELIIGDRQTGKTTIALDTIINQKGKDVKCVYVAIGQKNATVSQIVRTLYANECMSYTTVVSATASDTTALQYIAPYSGMAIAEEWLSNGENVLIVLDDLTKHANAYRTISLLLRRPPGREAYPGDVFYLHSRLLERACKLNAKYSGGSITALPIVETQANDISAYIPTNIISITDGQLFLQSEAFNEGQRPAIDISLSVSRVGSAAQTKAIKKNSNSLKLQLAQYNDVKSFSKFSSDLDPETLLIIEHGSRVMEMIKQPANSQYTQTEEAIILQSISTKLIKFIPIEHIKEFISGYLKTCRETIMYKVIESEKRIDDSVNDSLLKTLKKFIKQYIVSISKYDITKYGREEELE